MKGTEPTETRVMKMFKSMLRWEHPSNMANMADLASMYREKCQWEEAEKLQVQVLETQKAKLGANHPDTLNSMTQLAFTYCKQDQ